MNVVGFVVMGRHGEGVQHPAELLDGGLPVQLQEHLHHLRVVGVVGALVDGDELENAFQGRVAYIGIDVGGEAPAKLGLIQSKELRLTGSIGSPGVWPETLRFLAGIGIGGLLPNIVALNAEFAPRRLQATAVMVSFAGITIGGSLPGPVAAYLVPTHGWQILFYLGGLVPLLLAGLIAAMLPESIRFLALKDRQAEAAAMVQRMDPGTVLPQLLQTG